MKLTKNEQRCIDNLLAAARALPRSISIDVEESEDGDSAVLSVWKNGKVEGGYNASEQVASLRKKSLKL